MRLMSQRIKPNNKLVKNTVCLRHLCQLEVPTWIAKQFPSAKDLLPPWEDRDPSQIKIGVGISGETCMVHKIID